MDKTLIWAGVTIVGIVTAAVTVLAALGKDTTALLAVISAVVVPLLAALGYSKLEGMRQSIDAVQRQTNGTQSRHLDMIERQLPPSMTGENDPRHPRL